MACPVVSTCAQASVLLAGRAYSTSIHSIEALPKNKETTAFRNSVHVLDARGAGRARSGKPRAGLPHVAVVQYVGVLAGH